MKKTVARQSSILKEASNRELNRCFGKTDWNPNGTTAKQVNPSLYPLGKSIMGYNRIVL